MSIQPKLLISVATLIAALAGIFAYLFLRTADEGAHPTETRLDGRLDRTSVRFHRALLARLAGEGDRFAVQLARAADDRAEAGTLARAILKDLEDGVSSDHHDPVLHHFGGPRLTPAMDRLHLVLAMMWSERHPERAKRIPPYAFIDEARALDVTRLQRPYAGLARAAQVFAHASGGYCDLMNPPDDGAMESLRGTEMLDEIGDADPEAAAQRLHLLQRFLVHGSLACCAMRTDRLDETTERLAQSIVDGEGLGLSPQRLGLLRAWTALLGGDQARAREELAGVAHEALHADDREAYRIIRSALATGGADAASRAHLGTTRVEWLSRLVVAAALEAVEGSELSEPLRTSGAAVAAQRMVRGEAAAIDAARQIEPFFDQGS